MQSCIKSIGGGLNTGLGRIASVAPFHRNKLRQSHRLAKDPDFISSFFKSTELRPGNRGSTTRGSRSGRGYS